MRSATDSDGIRTKGDLPRGKVQSFFYWQLGRKAVRVKNWAVIGGGYSFQQVRLPPLWPYRRMLPDRSRMSGRGKPRSGERMGQRVGDLRTMNSDLFISLEACDRTILKILYVNSSMMPNRR
jgi:hypothetical protein